MMIRMIEGATRIIGKAQGYLGLPLRDEFIHCSVNGPDTPAMVTAWEPDPAELAALNAGGSVYLRLIGTAHPPVMIWAGPAAEPRAKPQP